VQNFQLTSLPSEGPTMRPSDPQWGGGNARKIQKTSLVNRWFELNVKKLLEMSEFIQPSRISPEPFFSLFFLFLRDSNRLKKIYCPRHLFIPGLFSEKIVLMILLAILGHLL
jgi:hypothetical protein